MNPDIKAKWVAALRSGAFVQANTQLKKVAGGKITYCCLGVLCELADIQLRPIGNDHNNEYYRTWETTDSYLGPKALAAVGLTPDEQRHLAKLNDSQGKTFAQIADYIEANL